MSFLKFHDHLNGEQEKTGSHQGEALQRCQQTYETISPSIRLIQTSVTGQSGTETRL